MEPTRLDEEIAERKQVEKEGAMFPYRQLFVLFRMVLSRKKALSLAAKELVRIRSAASRIAPGEWQRPVRVPPMPGVTEVMRGWSAGMVLWHTHGANRAIQAIVMDLAEGSDPDLVDFKTFDNPPSEAGPEQLSLLEETVNGYFHAVDSLPGLRTRHCFMHPVFGKLNAHGWHCMFALHLRIHRRQLESIAELLSE